MATTESVDGVERAQLAAQVYIYGYPLVYKLHEIDGFANNIASIPFSAPYNQFGYARELLGPETEFVSPNNDTLYVVAACDVRQGPIVLHVPDTGGRYYVLQFVDAWTNNFAYIGRRGDGDERRRVSTRARRLGRRGACRHATGFGTRRDLRDRWSRPSRRGGRPSHGARPAGPVHAHLPGRSRRRTRTNHARYA